MVQQEREIVVALFAEKSEKLQALVKDSAVATTLEQVATEAVVVTKSADETLTISHSDHSVTRSLAILTAKLMIAVPLGFYGILASTAAGAEIAAAKRKRDARTEVDETDLSFLIEQMKPGWTAILAAYPHDYVEKAVVSLGKVGAVMVWHAPESRVMDALRKSQIED